MLPDLLRAASKGTGVFANYRFGFGLRNVEIQITILPTGDLSIEPWRIRDDKVKPRVLAPELRRSGKQTDGREQAIPLADRCDYTLGITEDKDRTKAELLNNGYLRDLKDMAAATGNPRLLLAHSVLTDRKKVAAAIVASKASFPPGTTLRSQDVAVVCDDHGPLCEDPDYITYWQTYVASEISDPSEPRQQCSLCGREDQPIVHKFGSEVVLTGQKCQISSFNAASFQSYGSKQSRQASVCVDCASRGPAAFQAMLQNGSQHSTVVYRHTPRSGKSEPMKCLTALWWIEPPTGVTEDLDDVMAGLSALEKDVPVVIGLQADDADPLARVEHLHALLETVRNGGLHRKAILDRTAFHVALLAPNTGRLIVRDHLRQNITSLVDSAERFILSARGFRYDEREKTMVRRSFGSASLAYMLHNRGTETPTLLRPLVRTAVCGDPPPSAIARTAIAKLTRLLVTGQKDDGIQDAATAALMIHLNHADPRYRTMTEANEITEEIAEPIESVAFLSGRLLAILDLIQRASDPKVPRTSAEKVINQAATFPARTMVSLMKRITSVYLPKLRDRMPGVAYQYDRTLNALVVRISDQGGLPEMLNANEEAEFMVGFLTQRGLSQQERQAKQDRARAPLEPTANA